MSKFQNFGLNFGMVASTVDIIKYNNSNNSNNSVNWLNSLFPIVVCTDWKIAVIGRQ